jgi:hypothetical protein
MVKLSGSILLALSISIVPLVAEADRDRGGSGGGGGRLGQVSSGLREATGGGSNGGGAPVVRDHRGDGGHDHRDHDYYDPTPGVYVEPGIVVGGSDPTAAGAPPPPRDVSIDAFAGGQWVHESDGALQLDLAFNDGRFRLGGSLSRYYEQQPEEASPLTFTLASLYMGLRIDDGGPTRVHLEAGAVGARTGNDPVMDSSVGGFVGGVRIEHRLQRGLALIGDAQAMVFEQDVRAGAVRVGVRLGYFQAALRYLDLNVGPALYGPEIGLSF